MLLRNCQLLSQRLNHLQRSLTCTCFTHTAQKTHGVKKSPQPPVPLPSLQDSLPPLPAVTASASLKTLMNKLSIDSGLDSMFLKEQPPLPGGYILPGAPSSVIHKQSILDPLTGSKVYELPTLSKVTLEKVEPEWQKITPVSDPAPKGRPTVEKKARAKLLIIRHKKMKKHQLRKFRKRMIFVHRRQSEVRAKKKEKKLQMIEREKIQKANDYDPEANAEEHRRLAKQGGWFIDTVALWKKEQRSHPSAEK